MGISVCAIAKKFEKSEFDTPYVLKKRCLEFRGNCTYLLRISSVSCSQDFRKVYVSASWNILGQLQKIDVCSCCCNSASENDVDHFFALTGVDRVMFITVRICVPCVACIMIPVHSVIYPFFLCRIFGQISCICLVYCQSNRLPQQTVFQIQRHLQF